MADGPRVIRAELAPQYRTASVNPLGKFDAKIDSFKFWEDAKTILKKQANAAGHSNLQDYIREVLLIQAYGADHMKRLHAERIERTAAMADESTAKGRAEGTAT